MIGWNADFCRELAGRGFFVIRYDNRDVGRSTRLDDAPAADAARARHAADQAPGVHALGHGGRRPRPARRARHRRRPRRRRVDGRHDRPGHGRRAPRPRALARLDHVHDRQPLEGPARAARDAVPARQAAEDRRRSRSSGWSSSSRFVGSPGFERDEQELRDVAALSWDRGPSTAGTGRQLAAIIASGDRTAAIGRVRIPTLVIHGTKDKLVRVSGGKATAKAIPGARADARRRHGPRPAARRLAAASSTGSPRRPRGPTRPAGALRPRAAPARPAVGCVADAERSTGGITGARAPAAARRRAAARAASTSGAAAGAAWSPGRACWRARPRLALGLAGGAGLLRSRRLARAAAARRPPRGRAAPRRAPGAPRPLPALAPLAARALARARALRCARSPPRRRLLQRRRELRVDRLDEAFGGRALRAEPAPLPVHRAGDDLVRVRDAVVVLRQVARARSRGRRRSTSGRRARRWRRSRRAAGPRR